MSQAIREAQRSVELALRHVNDEISTWLTLSLINPSMAYISTSRIKDWRGWRNPPGSKEKTAYNAP